MLQLKDSVAEWIKYKTHLRAADKTLTLDVRTHTD